MYDLKEHGTREDGGNDSHIVFLYRCSMLNVTRGLDKVGTVHEGISCIVCKRIYDEFADKHENRGRPTLKHTYT